MYDGSYDERREALFDAPCWVIDFLPKQVPPERGDRFFAAERYLLESPRIEALFRRFARLILNLSLYYVPFVSRGAEEEWIAAPDPRELVGMIEDCAAGEERKYLCVLFPAEDAMLTADGGDLYMSLYNPPEEMLETARLLAGAEGLFVRKAAE